jgi:hypothetical protein
MKDIYTWLKEDKGMKDRSARDVISRIKRVKRITNQSAISERSLGNLKECDEFVASSSCIRAQLNRAVGLQLEYLTTKK